MTNDHRLTNCLNGGTSIGYILGYSLGLGLNLVNNQVPECLILKVCA